MRKITKFLMAGLMLLTCAVGLSNTRGEVKEAEAAATKRVYFDGNDSGCSCVMGSGAIFKCHYWGGSSSSSWPGEAFTSNYITKWSRKIYYIDVPSDTTGIIFNRCDSSGNNIWNRWNVGPDSTYCITKGYNFYQPKSDGSAKSEYKYGTDTNGAGYNAVSLYVVTINKNNGEDVETVYNIPAWESGGYVAPSMENTATHTFDGWYTDSAFTNKYTTKTLTSDISLYAKWTKIETYESVKYFHGEKELKSLDIATNTTYNAEFIEEDGYKLEGWYTDEEFTTEYVNGTPLTSDLVLYGKFVEQKDFNIYLDASLYGKDKPMYAYMWRDDTSSIRYSNNASWPGEKIDETNNGIITIPIDASKAFQHIIFNDGSGQTSTLELVYEEGTLYTILKDTDSETKNLASITSTNFIVGQIDVEDETLGTAYKFFSALPVEAKKNDKEEYNVGLKFEFIKPGAEEVSATGYYTCSNLETLTYDADEDEVAEEHTATADGYKTYFAVTVYEIPEDYVGGKVIVTPAYQNTNGHTVMCISKTFTI